MQIRTRLHAAREAFRRYRLRRIFGDDEIMLSEQWLRETFPVGRLTEYEDFTARQGVSMITKDVETMRREEFWAMIARSRAPQITMTLSANVAPFVDTVETLRRRISGL